MKLIKIIVALVLIVGLFSGFKLGRSSATAGVIYVSPASTSVQINKDVTVALRINPGTAVNAVQANVAYNQSALSYVSTTLSAFPVCTENSGGGGTVSLACAQLGSSTSSDSLIADITFRALAGSGSTALVVSGQQADYDGTSTNPGSANGSVSFTSPAAPAPSTPKTVAHSDSGSSNSSSSSASTTSTSSPAPATPAPKVTITASIKSLQMSTADISISTNVPVQTAVDYGLSQSALSNSTTFDTSASTSSLISLTPLTPGTTYFYRVVARDGSGNLTDGSIEQLTTPGYTLSVTILDSNNHPLVNKLVTLHSAPLTVRTNSQGVATFTDVTPGLHHVEYTISGNTYTQPVYVENAVSASASTTSTSTTKQAAVAQTAAVILTGYKLPTNNYLWWALICVVGIGILVILLKKAPSLKLFSNRMSHASSMHFSLRH